jgi:hypothetical protein
MPEDADLCGPRVPLHSSLILARNIPHLPREDLQGGPEHGTLRLRALRGAKGHP